MFFKTYLFIEKVEKTIDDRDNKSCEDILLMAFILLSNLSKHWTWLQRLKHKEWLYSTFKS